MARGSSRADRALLDELEHAGVRCSPAQLHRWRGWRLLPAPIDIIRLGHAGSDAVLDPLSFDIAATLSPFTGRGGSSAVAAVALLERGLLPPHGPFCEALDRVLWRYMQPWRQLEEQALASLQQEPWWSGDPADLAGRVVALMPHSRLGRMLLSMMRDGLRVWNPELTFRRATELAKDLWWVGLAHSYAAPLSEQQTRLAEQQTRLAYKVSEEFGELSDDLRGMRELRMSDLAAFTYCEVVVGLHYVAAGESHPLSQGVLEGMFVIWTWRHHEGHPDQPLDEEALTLLKDSAVERMRRHQPDCADIDIPLSDSVWPKETTLWIDAAWRDLVPLTRKTAR